MTEVTEDGDNKGEGDVVIAGLIGAVEALARDPSTALGLQMIDCLNPEIPSEATATTHEEDQAEEETVAAIVAEMVAGDEDAAPQDQTARPPDPAHAAAAVINLSVVTVLDAFGTAERGQEVAQKETGLVVKIATVGRGDRARRHQGAVPLCQSEGDIPLHEADQSTVAVGVATRLRHLHAHALDLVVPAAADTPCLMIAVENRPRTGIDSAIAVYLQTVGMINGDAIGRLENIQRREARDVTVHRPPHLHLFVANLLIFWKMHLAPLHPSQIRAQKKKTKRWVSSKW